MVAIRLGGRRRRLVEWLGVEELNRSQHTQQLRQTRSIGRQQPHANPHADGARAGGSTIFGAGAGARSGLLLSETVVFCYARWSPTVSPPPRGQQGRCVYHSVLTAAHPPVASGRAPAARIEEGSLHSWPRRPRWHYIFKNDFLSLLSNHQILSNFFNLKSPGFSRSRVGNVAPVVPPDLPGSGPS